MVYNDGNTCKNISLISQDAYESQDHKLEKPKCNG